MAPVAPHLVMVSCVSRLQSQAVGKESYNHREEGITGSAVHNWEPCFEAGRYGHFHWRLTAIRRRVPAGRADVVKPDLTAIRG